MSNKKKPKPTPKKQAAPKKAKPVRSPKKASQPALACTLANSLSQKTPSGPVTYGQLFAYLEAELELTPCNHTLDHVETFAHLHHLPFIPLAQTLLDFRGVCDCEVVHSVGYQISPHEVICGESFMTSHQLAAERELFCHSTFEGNPISFKQAYNVYRYSPLAHHVNLGGVPCERDAVHARYDDERARALLFEMQREAIPSSL